MVKGLEHIKGGLRFGSFAAAVTVALIFSLQTADAQTWPNRPVRIVAPVTPGSVTDLLGRILADRLAPMLGQPVIVENRAGANTVLGTQYVTLEAPDGYTLLVAQPSMASTPVFQKVEYDPIRDFAPVSLVANAPVAIIVNSSIPVRTVTDLREFGKLRDIKYGSPGEGSASNFAIVILKGKLGIEMTSIPYRGSVATATGVASNEVPLGVAPIVAVMPFIQSGNVRPIAVLDAARSSLLPDVPTVGESVPGFEMDGWMGIFAPAKTPRVIIDRLNKAINEVVRDKEVAAKLIKAGLDPRGSTPEELAQKVVDEVAKYRDLVKLLNIKPQ
jgi:tripartite-type tricarboxylate transporter receptor subunit TctC